MKYDITKTADALEKVQEKIEKLTEKTDKELNKILSLIEKRRCFADKQKLRNALKGEFLAMLSQRVTGKIWLWADELNESN